MKAKRMLLLVVLAILSLGGIQSVRATNPSRDDDSFIYRLTAKDEAGHPRRVHRLRTSRSNYLALRKLQAGRYIVRYRVVIVEPAKHTERDSGFEPAASWHIVRE